MKKDFDGWIKKKLDRVEFDQYVHEREVWWCAVGINIGVEANGKHANFERPVLVLRKFNRHAVLVVPLTSRPKRNTYHWPFWHEGKLYAAVVSQIRLISTKRLLRKIYRMDDRIFGGLKSLLVVMIEHF